MKNKKNNKENKKSLLSFRTKAEVVLAVCLLIGIAVSSVMSGMITQTDKQTSTSDNDFIINFEDAWISALRNITHTWSINGTYADRWFNDSQDNIYSYIVNSNGNYWTATGANVQVAINDIGVDNQGTVWLPGTNTTVSSTITLLRNVTLDLGGGSLHAAADVNVIEMMPASRLKNGEIYTDAVADFSHAAIFLDGRNNFNVHQDTAGNKSGKHTDILHIDVIAGEQNGYGIHMLIPNTEGDHNIGFVNVEDYSSDGTNKSIFFDNQYSGSGQGGWINGNTFSNLQSCLDGWFIYVDGQMQDGTTELRTATSGNIFNNIMYQEHIDAIGAIYVEGYGNIFDNVIIWDWDNDEAGAPDDPSYDRNCSIYLSEVSKYTKVTGTYGISSTLNEGQYALTNSVSSMFNTTFRAIVLPSNAANRGINPGWSSSTGIGFYHSTSANPYTYWYGYVTGDADRYGAFVVDATGDWNFISEVGHIVLDPVVATKYVGINESSPTAELEIEGTGKITVDWTVDSDERIKQVIGLLPESAVRKFCENVSIYRYYKIENWEDENGNRIFGGITNSESLGIVAQELWNTANELFGEQYADLLVVKGNETELWTIRYSLVDLIFDRWCQILNNDIKDLEGRIAALESVIFG